MRTACWIARATDTHSEYVKLITLPMQQWLHERSSMLVYKYTVCFVQVYELHDCDHILVETFRKDTNRGQVFYVPECARRLLIMIDKNMSRTDIWDQRTDYHETWYVRTDIHGHPALVSSFKQPCLNRDLHVFTCVCPSPTCGSTMYTTAGTHYLPTVHHSTFNLPIKYGAQKLSNLFIYVIILK